MQVQQKYILFPANSIHGLHFNDMKQVRTALNSQARERKLQKMTSWFYLSGQDQNYTIMKCKVSPACKAFIKLLYSPRQGFFVDTLNNRHDHSQNSKFKQLKQHHILSPYIGKFEASNTTKQINVDDLYIVRTNCCCKNNPGDAAIAYDITSSKGELIIQNSKKFEELTNNKAQFTVLMYALMDCFEHGITKIQVRNRSKLLVDYMKGIMTISAHGLKDIAEAAKLLACRIGANVVYKTIEKSQTSVKLQYMCRKLLSMNQVGIKGS